MKQFAVAFTTTGNSPKEGHRFREIVLVGQEGGIPNSECARFKLDAASESNQQMTFPVALAAIKTLVGDAALIVHDAGSWRRFLRAELKSIKRHGANHLVTNVVEIRSWAHQRYPRQRKDVTAVAKRAGIEIPEGLSGLDLEAELLRRIANLMSVPANTLAAVTKTQTTEQSNRRNWIERAGNFWRNLTGRG